MNTNILETNDTSKEFLTLHLGKQVQYRYVDWSIDSYTPWHTLTEKVIVQLSNDRSIEKVKILIEGNISYWI